jgi:hypothetical protein
MFKNYARLVNQHLPPLSQLITSHDSNIFIFRRKSGRRIVWSVVPPKQCVSLSNEFSFHLPSTLFNFSLYSSKS